jgi:hypothetical protein
MSKPSQGSAEAARACRPLPSGRRQRCRTDDTAWPALERIETAAVVGMANPKPNGSIGATGWMPA